MFRAPISTFSLVAAFASGALAQEAKQPAVLPHMEDVKTAPLVYPKEPGNPSARHVDSTPAVDVRKARVDAAVGSVRHTPQYPLYDTDAKGTQWVRGATYKASFDSTGATYIPFLGSRAPRNHPVTMRVSGITAAGTAVQFDAGAAAARDGATLSFDRGSVVEQYLIQRDGVEQQFVFDALPARGEIVVTLDIETDLDVRGDADGVRFENALGHARYGRAVALDARGRSVAAEEHLQDGRVQLVVPASFVATAELPLVIDPFVSTFVVDQDANDDSNADVAFVDSPAALVVYEYAFSAVDHDIYSEKYVNQVYQGMALVDISIDDWRAPRVAANDLSGRWLCVAEVGTAGNRDIMGRTITASSLALGSVTTFSGSETGDKHAPDVGGDPYLVGPTYFLVVWQREYSATDTDIHARLVSSSGTPQGTSVIFLENSGGTLDSRPSISKTDGNGPAGGQNWSVVWQHEASSTDDDVQGARVHWDGSITDTTFTVAGTAANERFPTASEPINAVGSLSRPWLSVYTLDSDLRFRAWDGTSIVDTVDLAAPLTTSLSAPDVTTDGRLWMVSYTSRFNVIPFPDTDVRALSISSAGGSLYFSESSVSIASSSSENETRPRIAAPFRLCEVPWKYSAEAVVGMPEAPSTAVSSETNQFPAPVNKAPFGFTELAQPVVPEPPLPHGHVAFVPKQYEYAPASLALS
jgi:hypothetical protein